MSKLLRTDSIALGNVFSAIANNNTGIGTARDKSRSGIAVNAGVYRLDERLTGALVRKSGVLRRLVESYPLECAVDWVTLTAAEWDNDQELAQVDRYLDDLADGVGETSAREAFAAAGAIARQDGDGYILMGISDGRDPSEPVDENAIASVRWLMVVSDAELWPDDYSRGNPAKPDYYRYRQSQPKDDSAPSGSRWHKSRVLRFSGAKLYSPQQLRETGGRHDSVLQAVFDGWAAWEQGVMASSGMLADYSQGIYTMEGLSDLLLQDARNNTTTGQDQVRRRLHVLEMGRSAIKAILLDKEHEDFQYASRNYSGAHEIMRQLKEALIASVDMPAFKLFNQVGGDRGLASANTAGLAQRYEWASAKRAWAGSSFVPPYRKLARLVMLAQDGPTGGDLPESWMVKSASKVLLTPLEEIEMQNQAAERDERNIGSGIYSPDEARSQWRDGEWTGAIVLDEDADAPAGFADSAKDEPRADAVKLSDLEKEGGRVRYRGKRYTVNKPIKSSRKGAARMVLAVKNGYVRLVHFGPEDREGDRPTDPHSPAYWARREFEPEPVPHADARDPIALWNLGMIDQQQALIELGYSREDAAAIAARCDSEYRRDSAPPAVEVY